MSWQYLHKRDVRGIRVHESIFDRKFGSESAMYWPRLQKIKHKKKSSYAVLQSEKGFAVLDRQSAGAIILADFFNERNEAEWALILHAGIRSWPAAVSDAN